MESSKSPKVRASDHDNYNAISVISFLFPFIGFIMGAIFLTKDSKLEKKLGEHAVVVAVFGTIVGIILFIVYFEWEATQTIQQIY